MNTFQQIVSELPCRIRTSRSRCHPRCRNRAHKTPWTLNKNNILHWPKSRSSLVPSDGIVGPRQVIGVEIIAGRKWEDVVSPGGVKSYVSRLTRRALLI